MRGGFSLRRRTRVQGCEIITNNQQPTTNNQQPTTNNQQPTTNHQPLLISSLPSDL
ncbi:MAG: hypothetical protein ACR9NN_10185 [Nostochopsis sp.]